MKLGKWLVALSALCLPLVSHADTFAGTASFADTSSPNNNSYNFGGVFQDPSFSFSGGVGTVYNDPLTISTYFTFGGGSSPDDQLSVTLNFTDPNDATAGFGGTGDVTFFGFFSGSNIDWTTNSQVVTFGDGSSLQVTLPDFNYYGGVFDGGSDTEDVSMKVLTPESVTPEPSSLVLLGTGLLCLGGLVFYRKRLPMPGLRPLPLTSAF